MQNIREMLSDAVLAHSMMDITLNGKKVVDTIFELLDESKESLIEANKIDVANENGFTLNINKLLRLKEEFVDSEDEYRKVISMNKNKEINYMIGSETDKLGTICVVYDGNTYVMLEMVVKAILTHNSVVFSSESNHMQGTNDMLLVLIRRVLEAYSIDKKLIQIIYTTRYEELLSNSASIKKVIAIGDKEFRKKINLASAVEVISSGYDHYDIYIEDETNMELIVKILDANPNIDVYVKSGINLPFYESIEVLDLDEAIGMLNLNTAGFSAAIFTDNAENGSKFLREVACKNISVNSSPLMDNSTDIETTMLLNVKKLFYPNPLKETGNEGFEFPTARAILEQTKEKRNKAAMETAKEEVKVAKEEIEKVSKEMTDKLNAKEQEIEILKQRLVESKNVANKYMEGYKKSFLVRFFANMNKEEIDNDIKMLSE
ncbi:MAG: hypothetical protein IKL68_00870 [Clostridia bacterium]|nr:hypothetical protein [Clostridia bacterium]